MKRIRYRRTARDDLDAIWSRIAAHDPDAADRLIEDIRVAVLRLIDQPLSEPERPWLPKGQRGLSVRKHIVVYAVVAGQIAIIRVLDARRNLTNIMGK